MLQPSEEIKSKLDIVDVIRDYMPLNVAGVNFRARCPFHREKTPSFMVSPEKQIWHCFGCGKGGDVFSFVQEMENISFVEALRMLAPKAGVVLKKVDPKLTSQRNRLLDIIDLASRYYHEILLKSPSALAARKYLKERGLTDETIEEWRIGYSADEWDNLINWLKQEKYLDQEIFSAGLSVKSNQRIGFYDRFRGRIMFPLRDSGGQVVAFSARVSPAKEAEEKLGKYINSPQTMIYDKSKILFGLDMAKQAIKENDLAIIVEGQMDVITAHQHGFKNVVAASGTALTTEQVNLLKRYTKNIALAFDMDAAGELASERGIREALAAEMNIKVVDLLGYKDPDELIKKDPDAWKKNVAEAKPVMKYYFNKTFAKLDISRADDRRRAARILIPVIAKLASKIDQNYWLKDLSEKISTPENILQEDLQKVIKENKTQTTAASQEAEPAADQAFSREEKTSELLLALMLKNPTLLEYVLRHIQIEHLVGELNKSLYRNLIFYYNNIVKDLTDITQPSQAESLDYFNLKNWLISETSAADEASPDILVRHLDKLALLADRDYYNFEIEQSRNEAIRIVMFLKKYYLAIRMREIEKLVSQAEKNKDTEQAKVLMAEFKILSDEFRNIGL
jgi:DNA primase